ETATSLWRSWRPRPRYGYPSCTDRTCPQVRYDPVWRMQAGASGIGRIPRPHRWTTGILGIASDRSREMRVGGQAMATTARVAGLAVLLGFVFPGCRGPVADGQEPGADQAQLRAVLLAGPQAVRDGETDPPEPEPTYNGVPLSEWAKRLKDPDDENRLKAAKSIGWIRRAAKPAAPALAATLREDPDPGVRRAAAWALGMIGPPARGAVPALVAA